MKIAVHQLRVNVKSLAAEARFIRHEMRRTQSVEAKGSLAYHRRLRLKPEARLAHLALAYVKGVPYRKVENHCKDKVKSDALHKKINRFTDVVFDDVKGWLHT